MSLEYGAKCCRNALFLLSKNLVYQSDEESQIRLCALANAAYIGLAANNPMVALANARELINTKRSTDNFKYANYENSCETKVNF